MLNGGKPGYLGLWINLGMCVCVYSNYDVRGCKNYKLIDIIGGLKILWYTIVMIIFNLNIFWFFEYLLSVSKYVRNKEDWPRQICPFISTPPFQLAKDTLSLYVRKLNHGLLPLTQVQAPVTEWKDNSDQVSNLHTADISTGYSSSQYFISSGYKISPDIVKMVAKRKRNKSD